jgi:DnaJ-class molecular chaperone
MSDPDEPTRRKSGLIGAWEYWRECPYCEGTGEDEEEDICIQCEGEGMAWILDTEE